MKCLIERCNFCIIYVNFINLCKLLTIWVHEIISLTCFIFSLTNKETFSVNFFSKNVISVRLVKQKCITYITYQYQTSWLRQVAKCSKNTIINVIIQNSSIHSYLWRAWHWTWQNPCFYLLPILPCHIPWSHSSN